MPIIGIDLGKHSFRAVELDRKKDELSLLNLGTYQNPRLNLDSNMKEDIEIYSSALRDFFSEVGFDTSSVVASLNESYVYMRNIKLPTMSDKELKSTIQFEAEQYIPLPLSEVSLSYQVLDQDFTEKGKVNVQLVAAKKTVLEKYVQIVKGARLTPKAIEPETLALGRALGDTQTNPNGSLILDIGFSRTLIVISYGGFVRFTRSVLIGGDVLTKSIQQGLNLDNAQADEYKKIYGMDPNQVDGKIFDVLKPVIDNIIIEVKRASLFFTNHNPSANIKRVILSGGTAQMPGLLLYMAKNIDLEVELANSFKNLHISPKLVTQKNTIQDQSLIYSTAVGLALKEV